MAAYLDQGLLPAQPVRDDRPRRGRRARQAGRRAGPGHPPGLKIGVCGEHGGDPESIATFAAAGLDYVSCSPFRVPIARLAAAQAVLAGDTGPAGPVAPRPGGKPAPKPRPPAETRLGRGAQP